MTAAPDRRNDSTAERARPLIIAQAVALGLALAFLVIPGSAAFLDAFGPERLPYVYLLVAGFGAAVSFGLHRLQDRLGLYRLAVSTVALLGLLVAAGWALLLGDRAWAAFGLLILFALQLQLGFVFIGAQAGRAFDVQQIKRVFSRIVAGFVAGFMVGGFVADPLVDALGRAEHLLLLSTVASVALAAAMTATSPHVPEVETEEPDGQDATATTVAAGPSLRRLAANPLVAAVFGYQVLSAMGTQLLEYLVYDRAAATFTGTIELASFMGRYTAALNLVDLVILLSIGGLLMARYGLRFGIGANPVLVTGLVVLALVVIQLQGSSATALFVVVGVARIVDLTMADVATRTSVNATFQALPERHRLAAQLGVEGAGVPLALGLTAGIVLAINAIPGTTVTHIVWATAVVCALWCGASVVVFRRYRAAVVAGTRRRLLDGPELDLDEPVTADAVRSLAVSGAPDDVAPALGLLARGDGAALDDVLAVLVDEVDRGDGRPGVTATILPHLVERNPGAARLLALRSAESGDDTGLVAGLRALGRLDPPPSDAEARTEVAVLTTTADGGGPGAEAALGALVRRAMSGSEEAGSGWDRVRSAARSSDEDERTSAARVLAEAGVVPELDVLIDLLRDERHDVARSAIEAAVALDDPTRAALFAALTDGPVGDRRATVAVLRAWRADPGPVLGRAVAERLGEVDRVVEGHAVGFLSAAGFGADEEVRAAAMAVVEREVAQIEKAVAEAEAIGRPASRRGGEPSAHELLARALAQEATLGRRALLRALALCYDRRLVDRVSSMLVGDGGAEEVGRDDRERAMVLESLELVLDGGHRSTVLRALDHSPEPSGDGPDLDRIEAMITDTGWARHPDWLQATAIATLVEAHRRPAPSFASVEPQGPIAEQQLALARDL